MKLIHASAVIFGLVCAMGSPARAQKAIYIVRHAEKLDNTQASPLTDAGRERAHVLAHLLRDAKIKAIYVTSNAARTAETAKPLAALLNMTPLGTPNGDAATIAQKIKQNNAGDVVLVVGHTNTIPALIAQFDPSLSAAIAEDEFDRLYILVPTGPNQASLARLRY